MVINLLAFELRRSSDAYGVLVLLSIILVEVIMESVDDENSVEV